MARGPSWMTGKAGMRVRRWLEGPFPSACGLCGAGVGPGDALCAGCLAELERVVAPCTRCGEPDTVAGPCPRCRDREPRLAALHAPWRYTWPLDRLILARKHADDATAARVLRELARRAADELADAQRGTDPGPDCVVPVPLHPERYRERGFNQALELAQQVARRLEVPLASRLVVRVSATESQQGLGRRERRRNVARAFALRPGAEFPEAARVLLVDDVATTGATLDALAEALYAAGAARVEALTLARA
ncbi:ComF family protein [Thioalkalivibrio sp. ALE21]|nr:ComF family protein [Thioalkalivibrio sp. ALE21]